MYVAASSDLWRNATATRCTYVCTHYCGVGCWERDGVEGCQLVTTLTWLWSFLQLASLEERHQGQQSAIVCKLQMEKEKHRTHASLVLGEREMHGKETDEWKYVGVCSVPSCILMCCSFYWQLTRG